MVSVAAFRPLRFRLASRQPCTSSGGSHLTIIDVRIWCFQYPGSIHHMLYVHRPMHRCIILGSCFRRHRPSLGFQRNALHCWGLWPCRRRRAKLDWRLCALCMSRYRCRGKSPGRRCKSSVGHTSAYMELTTQQALFLEFLPMASNSLLTLLSVWWPLGQLIGSLVAWGFLANEKYACNPDLLSCNVSAPGAECCSKSMNMGWRYLNIVTGAMIFLMFVCRFFLFHLFESPKFLLSKGRQSEAVACVHGMAYKNGRKTWLSEEILNAVGGDQAVADDTKLSTVAIIKRFFGKFSKDRIGPLFATKRLGLMTFLIWFCWTTIGMGYPLFNAFLPQYLQNAGKDVEPTPNRILYRNYAITSIVGVPGSIIAAYTVDIKYIGRKYTIAISTLITGILLFLFTLSSDSNFQLIFSSLEAFFQSTLIFQQNHDDHVTLTLNRHYVWRALCIYPRSLPSSQPRNGHRNRISPE